MEPPTGTVTMLFTDIEGSTQLVRELGSRWPDALELHNSILRAAIERHGGYVAGTEGDSFFACFSLAGDAVGAAVDAQRELAATTWPRGCALKVRMGMHTGSVEYRELRYLGAEVHRAARVGAAANGGQLLLTRPTAALLAGAELPLDYVGEHRLKDFPHPEQLFHAVIDGSHAAEFPRLQTAVARPTNLREDLRPLIGRTAELERLRRLLTSEARLVTVVGTGGAGKTRLALAAARSLLDEMPGGAFIAPLATIRDPNVVLDAVVRALDLRSVNGDPAARIQAWVRGRHTLIVLDNFEQLLAGAPVVSRLVEHAPELRVLVTSQAALHVAGEVVVALDALELDAAADLFVQRAQAVAPRWAPSVGDHEAILEICRRVGCLPLAIELAAARTSVLDPKELLSRLARSSELLRGGTRDAPERHQSLRATFEWTHGLLGGPEQVLFRRLGTFAGAVALEAIEAVCEIPADEMLVSALDALEGLIEFSLVARNQGSEHGLGFTMPQALRDFAKAELIGSGEEQLVRRRHAEHVAVVADQARIWFVADAQTRNRVLALEAEIGPALAWASDNDRDVYRGLIAAVALGLIRRGQIREALDHTTRAGAEGEGPRDEIDAWLGNARAYALLMSGRLEEAAATIQPVIAFYRVVDNRRDLGLALHTAGWIEDDLANDLSRALAIGRESLELLQGTGDPALTGRGLMFLVQVLIHLNALDDAERTLDEAAASIMDPESDLANAAATLRGDAALARGDAATALEHFLSSLKLAAARGDGVQIINDAQCVAHALALTGHPEEALEVAGAAAAIAADGGHAVRFPYVEEAIDAAREAVGSASDELVARGRGIPPGERVARVLTLGEVPSR